MPLLVSLELRNHSSDNRLFFVKMFLNVESTARVMKYSAQENTDPFYANFLNICDIN